MTQKTKKMKVELSPEEVLKLLGVTDYHYIDYCPNCGSHIKKGIAVGYGDIKKLFVRFINGTKG